MYTHTPMVLQQMSQYSQHQSTARIRVPSGPFGLAEQGLMFEHVFLFQILHRVGTLGIYSILTTNQQLFGGDTIKYYSIPSVPSRLEGVKTRPERVILVQQDRTAHLESEYVQLVGAGSVATFAGGP